MGSHETRVLVQKATRYPRGLESLINIEGSTQLARLSEQEGFRQRQCQLTGPTGFYSLCALFTERNCSTAVDSTL